MKLDKITQKSPELDKNNQNFLKNLIDENDKVALFNSIKDIVIPGISINLLLFVFGLTSITWYSWFCLGLGWRFIKVELIKSLRGLWFRR